MREIILTKEALIGLLFGLLDVQGLRIDLLIDLLDVIGLLIGLLDGKEIDDEVNSFLDK